MDLISLASFSLITLAVILYYILPARFRPFLLIITSALAYFKIAGVGMLVVQYVVIGATYWLGKKIAETDDDDERKKWFYLASAIALIPLIFFKYLYGLIPEGMLDSGLFKYIIAPLGVSYYSFMIIGFLVDLYYEEQEELPLFKYYAAFIGFFPLTLSGPIERTNSFLKQLIEHPKFNPDHIKFGVKLILWGCFLKLVMADRVSLYVDAVYNNIERHNALTLTLSSLLYPFQVYGDLGGYTLMVRGVAKLFGFDIVKNFNRPFMAQSVAGFWRRWHMSLINWLRDYMFTPIAFYFRSMGNNGSILALVITFALSGIWHDMELKYLLWGVFHSILLAIELLFFKISFGDALGDGKKVNVLRFTMNAVLVYVLFSISQVFVRVEDLTELKLYASRLTHFGGLYLDKTTLVYAAIGIIVVFLRDVFGEFFTTPKWIKSDPFQIVEFSFLFICILLFGIIDDSNFIYFQF